MDGGSNPLELLIAGMLGQDSVDASRSGPDDFYLEVNERLLQLQYVQARSQVIISSPVYIGRGDRSDLLEAVVAEFNAYHLLRGGYCLMIDEETSCLYVSQSRPVKLLDAERLSAILSDFERRAASCTAWYMDEVFNRQQAPAAISPFAAHATFAI